MPDAVIVTAADLEEVLTEFRLGVRLDNGDHEGATVSDPAVVADVLMRTLSTRFAAKLQGPPVILPPPPGDPELSRLAQVIELIDAIIASDHRARVRTIDYLDSRYGSTEATP